MLNTNTLIIQILWTLLFFIMHSSSGPHYYFRVREAQYTRLCSTKKILTVNGKYPGPTIHVRQGQTIFVTVHNKGRYNITIHWHGVKQPRNPWSDGPEYITQCPIQPGAKFKQKVIFSWEEGTLWWHAHSDWSRATVHGAIFVYPKHENGYPFPLPSADVPVILGAWWKKDVMEVFEEFVWSGGVSNVSDAFTINGQPGDLYPCSMSGTFRLVVEFGKTYLLRMLNAAMNEILFFGVANHDLTVVGADASYTKPLTREYIAITPGQTLDVLLHANQVPGQYYMAARAFSSNPGINFNNSTTTAIIQYDEDYNPSSSPKLPELPDFNDTNAAFAFFSSLRSLATEQNPVHVPLDIDAHILTTVSINTFPCSGNRPCEGPNRTILAASMSNISFQFPPIDVLEAYYYHINGVFGYNFPSNPPLIFNFTDPFFPLELQIPRRGTEAKVIPFNSRVEIVFQGTRLLGGGNDHPMHIHGYSFYVVGLGFGNFDENKDPLNFNLVDPPFRNTVAVPANGWAAIRFIAHNPGVWFVHCHFDRHMTWGMDTVIIVPDGQYNNEKLLPPPPNMPPC